GRSRRGDPHRRRDAPARPGRSGPHRRVRVRGPSPDRGPRAVDLRRTARTQGPGAAGEVRPGLRRAGAAVRAGQGVSARQFRDSARPGVGRKYPPSKMDVHQTGRPDSKDGGPMTNRILVRLGTTPFELADPYRTLDRNQLGTNSGNLNYGAAAHKLFFTEG